MQYVIRIHFCRSNELDARSVASLKSGSSSSGAHDSTSPRYLIFIFYNWRLLETVSVFENLHFRLSEISFWHQGGFV